MHMCEYNIEFNMGEGVEPSHHSKLIDLIGKTALSEQSMMYEYMTIAPNTIKVEIEVSITKLSLEKYGDDVYKVGIMLQNDDENHFQFNGYLSLCHNIIIALYRENIIGKYIIYTKTSYIFKMNTLLPIGIKTVQYDLQTVSWLLSVILDKLDKEGDTETFNKIFENMSNEQFQTVKGLLYHSIMYKYDPNNICIWPTHIYNDQSKAIFLHWCNKFAMESNEDTMIGL